MGGGQVVYTKKRNWNDQHTARININLATQPIRLKTLIKDINTYELVMRKPAFCICENKDADQLRGNREADQRLFFRYTDSTIPLLPIYEITSL